MSRHSSGGLVWLRLLSVTPELRGLVWLTLMSVTPELMGSGVVDSAAVCHARALGSGVVDSAAVCHARALGSGVVRAAVCHVRALGSGVVRAAVYHAGALGACVVDNVAVCLQESKCFFSTRKKIVWGVLCLRPKGSIFESCIRRAVSLVKFSYICAQKLA